MKGYSTAMYGWSERRIQAGEAVDWDVIYRECAESGFKAVEISSARLGHVEMIHNYGLQVSAAYAGYPLLESGLADQLKEQIIPMVEMLARDTQCSDFLVNTNLKGTGSNPQLKSEDELKRQGEYLSLISSWVEPYGMKVCMHNHAAQFLHTQADLRSVIEYADDSVGLCVDTGWAYVSGIDPIEWVRAYPERIFATHLRNQRGNIPTEDLAEGDLAIGPFVKELLQSSYKGWISLELWHPNDTKAQRSMKEDAQSSLQFLDQWLVK